MTNKRRFSADKQDMAPAPQTSSSEIERVRDKWLEAREDHSKLVWGEEYRRLSKKDLLEQETALHAQHYLASHSTGNRHRKLIGRHIFYIVNALDRSCRSL